jgi:hypothetical protein
MVVAYIAYKNLKQPLRDRVDQLLKRNPMYMTWIAGVPAAQRGLVAFIKAATWPDCIKRTSECPGYHEDGTDGGETPPTDGTATRNIGYADKAMHKYWHFEDLPFSPSGLPTVGPKSSNAALQIPIFRTAIAAPSTTTSADIKSYDIAWLEHLVGDIHQPLHATSRFTSNHPHGDVGGNDVTFCNSPCKDNLHAYWDDLLGTQVTLKAISGIADKMLLLPKPAGADNEDVDKWAHDSFDLAKANAYRTPISADDNASMPLSARPDASYKTNATKIAQDQVLLAGYRLAKLLNDHLK